LCAAGAWIGGELSNPREVGAVLSLKMMEQHNLFVGDWYRLALAAEMEQARRPAINPDLQR